MSEEEIQKALEIIKQPITVNCIDYHYFDQENYNKIVKVYDNCQWFITNIEQIIDNCNELKSRIDKAIEIIESYNLGKYDYSVPPGGIIDLLEILKGKSE